VSVVGLKSLDVSPCNELLLLPMIIKNSLARKYFFVTSMTSLLDIYVHCGTGSPGQLGLRVAGFPGSLGRWVTKCDPDPCLVRANGEYRTFVPRTTKVDGTEGALSDKLRNVHDMSHA